MDESEEKEETRKFNADEETQRELKEEHTRLDQKVAELESVRFLSDSEEIELKKLKKQKLLIKEKIEKSLFRTPGG